jgi:hypothetical protein
MPLQRGFKAQAERTAADVRDELGLKLDDRLDPLDLAKHLGIPVLSLSSLPDIAPGTEGIADAVAHLRAERGALSAVTVFFGTARAIVNNDANLPARQASNLAHELAHGLLLHPPTPALDRRGCPYGTRTSRMRLTGSAPPYSSPGLPPAPQPAAG